MTRRSTKLDIGIVGAGWSGIAAAIELIGAGFRVTLYESAKIAGGRARRVEAKEGAIDNGQHLLIGAYSETLRLMEVVSPGSTSTAFMRLPLTLDYPQGVLLKAPRLPAPLHLFAGLLLAHGFSLAEKLAALHFIRTLHKKGFRVDAPASVATSISGQPEKIRRFLWEPLCVAALNTPTNQASFDIFVRVLKDSLTGSRANSDFLIPRRDLSSLFPEPAIRWVRQQGGRVKMQHRIRSIKKTSQGWLAGWETGEAHHDAIIIATAPAQAASLLGPFHECRTHIEQIEALPYQPIVTVYAEFPARLTFRTPLTGWTDPVPLFIFDLDATHGHKGWVAAVASAKGPHLDWNDERWLAEIHTRLEQALGPLPAPSLIKRITEKRATFACTTDVVRPSPVTPLKELYLAGDYVEGPYPSTLEGAVRSGVQCARRLMQRS